MQICCNSVLFYFIRSQIETGEEHISRPNFERRMAIAISTAMNPDTLMLHENNQAEPAEHALLVVAPVDRDGIRSTLISRRLDAEDAGARVRGLGDGCHFIGFFYSSAFWICSRGEVSKPHILVYRGISPLVDSSASNSCLMTFPE